MRNEENNIIDIFKKSGALITGHFKLSSGLHSGQYLQCALVLQEPVYAGQLGKAIAAKFKNDGITVVAGPAIGGIIIAHEAARALGVRCIFGEREDSRMKLRRGFRVNPHDRILIVEDVITTGSSLKELADFITKAGGKIAGAASIIDRSKKDIDFGVKKEHLVKLDIKTFNPEECPLCQSNIPITKPGSRK
ncbi:MAG: orotate phosphoribosyltransferase [Candidatus Omnitrophota bacterium]|nr:orotate phosphoribosyltransferase [Candidatus Omnitrophota bacterium]